MIDGIYYLNNSGSRWIIVEGGRRVRVKVNPDKYNGLKNFIIRSPNYFEAFGNFVRICVNIGGKKIMTMNYQLLNA